MREPFEVPYPVVSKIWLAPSCVQTWQGCFQQGSNIIKAEYGSPFLGRSMPHQPIQPLTEFSDFFFSPKKNLNKEQGCESSDFNLISRFCFFWLYTKLHFQTFWCSLNALKSTSFQAFQIISDLFLTDILTPHERAECNKQAYPANNSTIVPGISLRIEIEWNVAALYLLFGLFIFSCFEAARVLRIWIRENHKNCHLVYKPVSLILMSCNISSKPRSEFPAKKKRKQQNVKFERDRALYEK